MSPLAFILLLLGLLVILWIAYRIGKVLLRLALGLAMLGLLAYGIWYYLMR